MFKLSLHSKYCIYSLLQRNLATERLALCPPPPDDVPTIASQEGVDGGHDAKEPIHEEEHAAAPSGRLTMVAPGEEGAKDELRGRDEVDTPMRITSLLKSSIDAPPIPSEQVEQNLIADIDGERAAHRHSPAKYRYTFWRKMGSSCLPCLPGCRANDDILSDYSAAADFR